MSETRQTFDPFEGKTVTIRNDLVRRLRGQYAIGPTLPSGEPEFGWREFETPPIQKEAAAVIERLRSRDEAFEGLLAALRGTVEIIKGCVRRPALIRKIAQIEAAIRAAEPSDATEGKGAP